MDALADDFLHGGVDTADAGAALYVAAALQVYFSRLAASLPGHPCVCSLNADCAPVAAPRRCPAWSLKTARPGVPATSIARSAPPLGTNVRAVCITCGQFALRRAEAIEGESGAVKAETCDDCHNVREDALPSARH